MLPLGLFSLLLTDAQLLTIKSTEENDFVSKYLDNDPLITSRTWLGMTLDTQGNAIIYNVCENNDLNIKLGITHIFISVFSCRKTSILAGWLISGLLQLEA